MEILQSISPIVWGIAAGAAGVLALLRFAKKVPKKEDYYDEEESFPDFVEAARMDEVRPGRKIRVLVLENTKEVSTESAANATIFLVHGANARMAQFYSVARRLQKLGYRIVAYDAFGGGRTLKPRDWTAYSTSEYKLDFEAVFAKYAAGVGKNFVVGHSFGTVLSVHIAGKEPRKVAGLILLSSAEHVREGGHPILSLPEWFLSLWFMRKLLGNGFRKLAFHRSCHPALLRDHEMMGKSNTIFAVKAFAAQMKWMDAGMVRRVLQPVDMVHGLDDRLLKLDNARRLAALIPNLKSMRVIDNCSHMIMMEKPQEVTEAIHAAVSDTWSRNVRMV